MKKNIVITITVLALIAGGFYVWRQGGEKEAVEDITTVKETSQQELLSVDTSDEAIANWDTCRNEEYGYEFKYPSEWYVYEVFSGFNIVKKTNPCKILSSNSIEVSPVSATIPRTREFTPARFSLTVQNQTDFENTRFFGIQSVDDYYKRSSEVAPGLPSLEADTERKTNIDGETAFWKNNNPRNSIQSTHVQFFHNDSLFWINADFLDYKLTNAIVSTFKFLD